MRGEKGLVSWRFSGSKARYIDRYIKKDQRLEKKAKDNKRKNIDVNKAAEELLCFIR